MILKNGCHSLFLEKYRKESIIFLLAVIFQIGVFIILSVYFNSPDNFIGMTGDAYAYKTATENIIKHKTFSLLPNEPFPPDSFRSPGYPFFLTPLFLVTQNWQIVLILQSILYAFVPLLIYLIGKQIHEKSAFIASLIFVFEPTRLFLSNSLLTDSLFTLLFLSFLFYLFKILDNFTLKNALFGGLFLGLATLVRPISVFLPVFVVVLIIIKFGFNKKLKSAIAPSVIFLLIFIAVLFPWSLRNKIQFDSWQLSSIGSYNLVYYNIPEFLRYKNGTAEDRRLEALYEENKNLPFLEQLSLRRSDAHQSIAKEILLEDPDGYLKFHLIKTIPFFVTDGLREIGRTIGILEPQILNFSTLITKGNFAEVFNFIKKLETDTILFLLGFIFWLIVTILAFTEVLFSFIFNSGYKYKIAILIFLILYFALLTGPVSNSRYRLPVSGIMIFLSVLSLYDLKYVQRRKESNI